MNTKAGIYDLLYSGCHTYDKSSLSELPDTCTVTIESEGKTINEVKLR